MYHLGVKVRDIGVEDMNRDFGRRMEMIENQIGIFDYLNTEETPTKGHKEL